MIADLFICDKSFAYNQIDSLQEINKKILQMKGLFDAIKKHKTDNKLRLQTENFIQTIIYPDGTTIEDIIWKTQELKGKISRDVLNLFQSLITQSKQCTFSYNDMIEALGPEYETEDECNGIIAMNKIIKLDECKQVLYDEKGFYRFRHYYLGKYPKNAKYFLIQIDQYFNKIKLSKDRKYMEERIAEVLHKSDKIIKVLTVLNDSFEEEFKQKDKDGHYNINAFLDALAKRHNIDEGSVEGSKTKNELLCYFEGWDGKHYCGPHLKYKPNNNNPHEDQLRIYFCWNEKDLTYIYIGLKCRHVKTGKIERSK